MLALALGGRTVAELEAAITPGELDDWIAFDAETPLGPEWAYWRTGQVAALIANIHRDPKKSQPFTPVDFLPASVVAAGKSARVKARAGAPLTREQRQAEARKVKALFAAAFGARVKDGNPASPPAPPEPRSKPKGK